MWYLTFCFPVLHHLPQLAQIHVHWVSDTTQSSRPLSSPSPPVFNLSQHQGLFQWVSSSNQVAKVLEFQLQHQSFQWIFRFDLLQVNQFKHKISLNSVLSKKSLNTVLLTDFFSLRFFSLSSFMTYFLFFLFNFILLSLLYMGIFSFYFYNKISFI